MPFICLFENCICVSRGLCMFMPHTTCPIKADVLSSVHRVFSTVDMVEKCWRFFQVTVLNLPCLRIYHSLHHIRWRCIVFLTYEDGARDLTPKSSRPCNITGIRAYHFARCPEYSICSLNSNLASYFQVRQNRMQPELVADDLMLVS